MDCLPQLHVAAYHARPGYNNDTPGIGVLCALAPKVDFGVGTYYNSVRKQSTYIGLAWQPYSVGPVSFGVMGGAVTGYSSYPRILGAAVASVPAGPLILHFTAVPGASNSPAVAAFSISWKM